MTPHPPSAAPACGMHGVGGMPGAVRKSQPRRPAPAARSERNLVVEIVAFVGAGEGRLPGTGKARAGGPEITIRLRTARPAARAIKQRELRIETLQDDLGRITVLAVLVLPFARLQRALEIDLGALLQVLLRHLGKVLVEDDH